MTSLPVERTSLHDFGTTFPTAIARLAQEEGDISILFSGGLDSSLIAWELRDRPGLHLWTVGRHGSPDLSAARSAAEVLRLPWEHSEVGLREVESVLDRFAADLDGIDGPPLDVAVAFALALEHAPSQRVVAGQGADELFLGYAHFHELPPDAAARRAELDLRRLIEIEWPRARRIAARAGHDLSAPFLDSEVQRSVQALPLSVRLPGDLPKRWLREWAIARGLAPEIANRPKRAIQYGSHVHRMLRELRPAPRSR